MVGATSTQIMEFVCLAHANLYDERIQLTSLASLGIGMTPCGTGLTNGHAKEIKGAGLSVRLDLALRNFLEKAIILVC